MTFSAPILQGRTPLRDPVVLAHYLPCFIGENPGAFPHPEPETKNLILPPLDPWRHWRDSRSQYRRTHLYQPLWGHYDSRDPEILQTQFTTAHAHGLDGFIVNLYGKNSVENVLGLTFLRELRRYNAAHPDRPFVYVL